MLTQTLTQLALEALVLTLALSAPLVGVAALVGLVLGFLQAVTQLQDATTAFALKLLAVSGVLALMMPWLGARLLRYGERLFELVSTVKL